MNFTSAQLNYLDVAVAIIEGHAGNRIPKYSTDWSMAGPIIEREKIELVPSVDGTKWYAESLDRKCRIEGCETPLLAAMNCHVRSHSHKLTSFLFPLQGRTS